MCPEERDLLARVVALEEEIGRTLHDLSAQRHHLQLAARRLRTGMDAGRVLAELRRHTWVMDGVEVLR